MDAKTLKALKGSIRKWEAIVAGTGADKGGKNCPLCKLFATGVSIGKCKGCPVRQKTGFEECRDTPYYDFAMESTFRAEDRGRVADTPEAKAAAQAELDFLRSLLPPAEEA